MPENNDFGFNVLVGDRLLWEYYADGKIYVESSTQSSNSYKILSENGNEVSMIYLIDLDLLDRFRSTSLPILDMD